ncbi:transmembrane amino acid transporter protein-domain-containing protein [Elsinoe ampelina]|uniref:Transmembrane amino acid transporter protein-domain-containing protein n=1 Tax=Elsinoe ampelina TaxID=302913 RepID=A0A6A6G813_9PEZI|nr:transmembrane amino acid transporter protein-domain-containing protein [Elsinoe ampelina]
MSRRESSVSQQRRFRDSSPAHSNRIEHVLSNSPSRSVSTARLASPLPGTTPPVRQIPIPASQQQSQQPSDTQTPLTGVPSSQSSLPGPRASSLSQALRQAGGNSPPRFGTPPIRNASPAPNRSESISIRKGPASNYGSFDGRSGDLGKSPAKNEPIEDIETVRRHLIGPSQAGGSNTNLPAEDQSIAPPVRGASPAPGLDEDEFSSLQLQGGDITRHIYKYTEDREREMREDEDRRQGRLKRSLSMNVPASEVEDSDITNIRKPGGLRRDFIRRNAESPAPSARDHDPEVGLLSGQARPQPQFATSNFIEFLTLYGHFAGETLDEDDEVLEPDEYFSSDATDVGADDDDQREREYGEDSALLTPGKRKRRRKEAHKGKGSPGGAALLLLKSFVGTGVLFLPRAFLNGGMLFSTLVLLFISGLSFWCFILLVKTRLKVHASFGDMGGRIYGPYFKNLINFSLVLSQIGFASAYIVFVSENLQAFILAVSNCKTYIDIKYMILMQMIVFLPLSLYRNINNIQKLALIADLFIALGLIYLYYYGIRTISEQGVADIVPFNAKSWTLFIGTAIFTFEGIGLIIPIQSGMAEPARFPKVLGNVMIAITVVFVSMGALAYAAFGSKTKTVIILNLPQDDKFVNGVQFIYSLAILLSTPLQIYPAIEITSQQLFSRTGKYNPWIKWKKNVFRFFMVVVCAVIAYAGAGDLDKFVALVGSFACVPLVYIYPPMMHYRVVSTKLWQRIADVSLVIFGFVVMAYTTTLTIISWTSGSGGGKAPGYCDG